jgi:hypothetical protein
MTRLALRGGIGQALMTSDDERTPGWYSDPTGRHGLRWWDGTVWSERVAETTEDDVVGATPSGALETLTEDDPGSDPVVTTAPEPDSKSVDTPTSADSGTDVRDALVPIGLALVAAVIMVGGSFLSWLNTELPAGRSGEMTGWELTDIPKLADVQRSDPRPAEGPSFDTADALAQALTAKSFPCSLVVDPAGIPTDAPFTSRGGCAPRGAPPGTPSERVFAAAAPKFTVSATQQDNDQVVESYLDAVARADQGPGIRGYALILYGPNWSMSANDAPALVKAKAAIGGTLLSTDVERNQFYVADLFSLGFFTGLTTVILGAATVLLAVVFALAVVVARRSARPVPGWRAVGAPLLVAALAGAIGLNWISWFTRGDGYAGVRLEIGFFLVTLGAVLAVWALASFVTFGRGNEAEH